MQQNIKYKWLHKSFVFLLSILVAASFMVPGSFGAFGAQEAKAANLTSKTTVDWKFVNSLTDSTEISEIGGGSGGYTRALEVTFDIEPDTVLQAGDTVYIRLERFNPSGGYGGMYPTEWADYVVDGKVVGEWRINWGFDFRIKDDGAGLRYLRGIKLKSRIWLVSSKNYDTISEVTLNGKTKEYMFRAYNINGTTLGSDRLDPRGSGNTSVAWRLYSNNEEFGKLAANTPNPQGQNYTPQTTFVEQEIVGGKIKYIQIWGHSPRCYTTDQTHKKFYETNVYDRCTVDGRDITLAMLSKFDKLTPNTGETLEQFKARIKSKPLQYGIYDEEPLAGQVIHHVLVNYGKVGENGQKLKDYWGEKYTEWLAKYDLTSVGFLNPNEYTLAKQWYERVAGEGNAINGHIGSYDLQVEVDYSPKALATVQAIGRIEYDGEESGEFVRTATVRPLDTPDPSEIPPLPAKLGAGWQIIDNNTKAALNGATVKVQTKNGSTWEDAAISTQKSRTIDGIAGRVKFDGLHVGTHRLVVTAVDGGKHTVPTGGVISKEFTLRETDTEGVNLNPGYVDQKTYGVTYKYQKASGSTPALPSAISNPATAGNYQVKDDTKYIEGWLVERKNPASSNYKDSANNGEWNLKWNANTARMTTSGVTFTGTWTFTADPADTSAINDAKSKISNVRNDLELTKTSADGKDVWPADKWAKAADKTAMNNAIAAAEKVINKSGVTKTELQNAVAALDTAITKWNAAKKAGLKNTLNAEEQKILTAAKNAPNGVYVSTNGHDVWPADKWVSAEAKKALEDAVKAAETIIKDTSKTGAQKDKALNDLVNATDKFNNAKNNGFKNSPSAEEQKKVDDAKKNMAATRVSKDGKDVEPTDKWVTAEVKKALEDAIKAAEDAFKKPGVTGAEVEKALADLDDAQKAFDEAKKPGDQAAADARALAKAKSDAKAELDRVNVNLYEEPELSVVKKAIEDGKKAIDAATTIPQVDAAKKKAQDTIATQKTATQKQAERDAEQKKAENPKNIPAEVTGKTPANLVAVTKAITTAKNDGDLKGSTYAPLKFQSKKQTKKSIKLQWSKVKGAKQYTVYANQCGTKNKYKKVSTVKGKTLNVKKVAGKKLKKGANYKFLIIAENGDKVSAISKTLHIRTAGHKKYANYKSVSVKKTVIKKAKKLKKGKTLKLNAKGVVAKGKKVSVHVKTRYESANKKIATVTKAGKVKGIKKGKAKIYCYVQNGLAKVVTVTVK